MAGSTTKFDSDGLPIPSGAKQDTSVLDKEGLPVPPKKKDAAGSPAPSGSSPNQNPTEPPVGTGDSNPKQVTSNYKNNVLTPKDIGDQPVGAIGPPLEQLSSALNNKGKNLSDWSKSSSDAYMKGLVDRHQDVLNQISQISSSEKSKAIQEANNPGGLAKLQESEQYFRGQIQKEYDARKKRVVPDLVDHLKGVVGVENWIDAYNKPDTEVAGIKLKSPLQWNPETHRLTPQSTEWVAKHVDDQMNQKGDAAINAQVSGDLDKKDRTYQDLTKSVVDYLNTIPVQKKQKEFTDEFTRRHPQLRDALSATGDVNNYFSKDRVDEVNVKVNIDRDKSIINTQHKYFGKGGLAYQNKDFVGIQEKYAKLVGEGKMSDDVARKQIEEEIKQNPALKSLNDNYETEIRKISEKTQKDFQDYMISGLQKSKPKLTIYKDGSVGLAGMDEDKYKNLIARYEGGLNDIAIGMGMDSNEAWQRQANQKAKAVGAFGGSLGMSLNELSSAFSKYWFNKTQWGAKNVRYYEGQEISSPSVAQSDVAASWNWKGIESLKDPNFWLSKTGAMVPVIAGGSAIGLATDGAGMPEYIGWLANAGLFTAQSGLSTYNQMLNTRDAQGNQLTEADASTHMANQMKEDFLPNLMMMAVTSGAIFKAKNIARPTLGAAVRKGILGAAEAQPFFTWQGYNDYAEAQEAQGKPTDFWGYMQSKDFKDNLINGMVVGSGLSLLHAPGTYMKSVDHWTNMVHGSEGEFRNLIPQNYALGQEMAGNGNYLRDALKLHVFNTDSEGLNEEGKRNLADLKNALVYSVNLDRNIRSGNLDPKNVHDLYQAHNLALADQHDYLAEQAAKEGNKTLSDVYKDKAKDYREQAKAASNGEAKYTYLVNGEGHPIFLSDRSFDTLEKEGKISKWMKDGTVESVHKSDDPEFAARYNEFVTAKEDATVEGTGIMDHAKGLIEENKDKIGVYYAAAKEDPEAFFKTVADQTFGINSDGSKSDISGAEKETRALFGDDIVDTAKLLFPNTQQNEKLFSPEEGARQPAEAGAGAEGKDGRLPEGQPSGSSGEVESAPQKVAPEDNITVGEMLDKKGLYKGQRGTFSQDGQTVIFKVDNSNREYELGNINDVSGHSLKYFGIEQENSVVSSNESGNVVVRGKEYINKYSDPLQAINYDKEGNLVSVTLDTPGGEKRTFRGPVAEDIAYQITLKQISDNHEQPALEAFINSDEAAREEINNAGLAAPTEGKATGDNAPVQREKIKPNGTVTGFKTSKGSTYEVHEDGSTTRNKAARPEHPGEEGAQPKSKKTYYVTKDDLGKLDLVQTQGWKEGESPTIAELPDGRIGVGMLGGENHGKVIPKTIVDPKAEPAKGLYPVEVWEGVSQPHFGNEITETISSPIKSENDGKKTKEAKGRQGDVLTPEEGPDKKSPEKAQSTAPPPITPPELPRVTKESPKEEFTAVRKEKNAEIKGAKELFERQRVIKWTETYDNALGNVQGMYPDKGLYEAMKSRVNEFVAKVDIGVLFNPTSEDIAVFNVFKNETMRRMNEIPGWDSSDNIQRMAAVAEFTVLQNDLFNVARVTNPGGEAGRAFNLLQSEIAQDPEYGLQVRRMELLGAKGGGKLSQEDLDFTSENWQKERALIDQENDLKQKGMEEKFSKEIAKVKADYEKRLKEAKADKKPSQSEKREKLLSEKGADFAAKIRAGKLKGTYATFPGLPQAINLVLEGLAQIVEKGSTLAEAISEYVKANNIKNREQFQKDLFEVFNKQERQGDSYERIRKAAEASATTDVTNDMVGKNMIRDYIDSHVGLHDPKDVLDIAHASLKEILPSLDNDRLREAYLKQGEFKQPTKKELEGGFRQSQKNFDRLTKIEKDIADLQQKGDIFKKSSNKPSPYDKDIEDKEKEKKAIMDSMGINTSGEDKYKKATYDQRAKSHNDRIDAMSSSIQDKIEKAGVSDKTQKALIKLKNQLDAAKITLDPNSAVSQERTLDGGLALLKSIKSEFQRNAADDISKVGDVNRSLQRIVDGFGSDKNESEQNVKLQRAKDKAKRDSEELFRKISNGEYEDKPVVELTKSDAELIKLERQRGALRQIYDNRKTEYQKTNQSWRKRIGEFLRSSEVAFLLKSPFTVLKVGSSALLRPNLEALTKATLGKGFEALPFETTKAISDRAKAGGESQSISSIKKGYEAYFKQYGEEKIKKLYDDANDKYEKSSQAYIEQEKEVNRVKYAYGKDTPEYKEADKKLSDLKNRRDGDLVSAVGNSVYQFIGGGSLREAWEVLLHRSAAIERQFGDFSKEGWTKGAVGDNRSVKISNALDNLSYLMNFTGRSHAALKNFSSRFSFAAGFMARLEYAAGNDVDISRPEKILELAHESYLDWDRGKYQESNWVSDTWSRWTRATEKVSPELALLLKADIAITRVPVNMLREGIMEYSLGAIRGSVMAAREYYKAKGIVLQDGYTPENEAQFRKELREQLNKIDPDKAATILRAFRKGGFGLGMYALALTGYASFGGFAHKGMTAEDIKKKKREIETGIPELKTTEIELGDYKLPGWASKVIEHTPAFQPMLFAAGLGQVYKNNVVDGKSTSQSAYEDAMAHVEHVVNSIPQAELVTAISSGILSKVKPDNKWEDVDQDGNPMKRQVFRSGDYFKYLHFGDAFGLDLHLGDKTSILSENYYKMAVGIQKSYRQQITDVEMNTSLSKKEKEEQRDDFLKQMEEEINDVYKSNKEDPQ